MPMSDLLVFLSGEHSCDWLLTGAARTTEPAHGDATAYADLPRADHVIAIVPAPNMRTLCLPLPPTPADKRLAVVRFALEDQLAGDVDAQHVVIARERERAAVVHVVDRLWLRRIVALLARHAAQPASVVAESDLVPAAPGTLGTWMWRDDGG